MTWYSASSFFKAVSFWYLRSVFIVGKGMLINCKSKPWAFRFLIRSSSNWRCRALYFLRSSCVHSLAYFLMPPKLGMLTSPNDLQKKQPHWSTTNSTTIETTKQTWAHELPTTEINIIGWWHAQASKSSKQINFTDFECKLSCGSMHLPSFLYCFHLLTKLSTTFKLYLYVPAAVGDRIKT